jgi:hypothetical protein
MKTDPLSSGTNATRPTDGLAKSSHTPGPWEIRSRHESSMDHTTVIRSIAIPGHDYIVISRIVDPTPYQDQVARANVRLIAAAPDLLTLAKQYANECSECGGTGMDSLGLLGCLDCEDIRAVIAKAEGRS